MPRSQAKNAPEVKVQMHKNPHWRIEVEKKNEETNTGENRRFEQRFFTGIVFETVFYPLNCIFVEENLEQMKALCMLCLMD